MANKYMEIDDSRMYSDRLEISGPPEQTRNMFMARDDYMFAPMEMRRGHYQRSNEVLKNGAVVYQWMGWRK
jgi:hypothetical protein